VGNYKSRILLMAFDIEDFTLTPRFALR
jgi:hypothetical protein